MDNTSEICKLVITAQGHVAFNNYEAVLQNSERIYIFIPAMQEVVFPAPFGLCDLTPAV